MVGTQIPKPGFPFRAAQIDHPSKNRIQHRFDHNIPPPHCQLYIRLPVTQRVISANGCANSIARTSAVAAPGGLACSCCGLTTRRLSQVLEAIGMPTPRNADHPCFRALCLKMKRHIPLHEVILEVANLKRDALIMLVMRVAGTLLWMAYTVVLARTLTKSDFAIALYVVNFAFTAVLVITLGRDVALMKFASQAWGERRSGIIPALLNQSRRLLLLSGGALCVVLCTLWAAGIRTPISQELGVAVMTGLITLVAAQMGLNRDCLRAVGRVWQSQLGLNFTRSIIPLAGSGIVYYFGTMTLYWALLLFLASLLLSLAVENYFLSQVEWSQDKSGKAEYLRLQGRTGLELWPGDIANALQMRMAGLIAGLLLPPEALALFLAAERIAGLAQFPIGAAAQAAAPRIARAAVAGKDEIQRAVHEAGKVMSFGALIGAGGTAIIAWPALKLLGPGFVDAFSVTLMLTGAHLSWMVFGLAQTTLNLTGLSRQYSYISIAMAAVGCLGIIAATFLRGSDHAGLAIATTYCAIWWTTNFVYTVTLYRITGIRSGLFQFLR